MAGGSGGSTGDPGGGRGMEFADPRSDSEHGDRSGVIHDEDRQRLLQALQFLEPDQRAVLMLRDSQGLDYDQIASVMGVAVGTIKSRLFRARAALREQMERGETG